MRWHPAAAVQMVLEPENRPARRRRRRRSGPSARNRCPGSGSEPRDRWYSPSIQAQPSADGSVVGRSPGAPLSVRPSVPGGRPVHDGRHAVVRRAEPVSGCGPGAGARRSWRCAARSQHLAQNQRLARSHRLCAGPGRSYGISPWPSWVRWTTNPGPELTRRLARVATRAHPLALSLGSAGRFGNRVLWTGCAVTRTRCGGWPRQYGPPPAGPDSCRGPPYRPHLTLARARGRRRPAPVVTSLANSPARHGPPSTCTWCAASSAAARRARRVRPPGLLATGPGPGRRQPFAARPGLRRHLAVAVESNPPPTLPPWLP